jgi:integrase
LSRGVRAGTLLRVGKHPDGTPRFRFRVRLADGTKSDRHDVPPGKDEDEARAYVASMQTLEETHHGALHRKEEAARVAAEKLAAVGVGDTADAYWIRLAKQRRAEGKRDVHHEMHLWTKWLSPRIGKRPIASITRDEIESIRDALDTEVRKRIAGGLGVGMSGKSAINIWSVLRIMFKESVGARDRMMRVRAEDPTAGHKAPLKTRDRKKTFLYPAEFARLMECRAVPREWCQLYAIACYLYLRPGELRALTWADVDLDARVVHVTKAYDEKGKQVAEPKTSNGVRDIPIEPTLVPLLEHLRSRVTELSAPVAPLLIVHDEQHRAKIFRGHLATAHVTRPRLTESTSSTMPINFRSCRDSGITWLALAGVALAKVQRRAGHDDISTTLGYVKAAEDLTGTAGAPFPPLPEHLLDHSLDHFFAFPPEKGPQMVPKEGVEPPT